MIVIVTFFPLFIFSRLFCTFTALYLATCMAGRRLWVVALLWAIAILLLLLVLVAAGFIGSSESDRKMYAYFAVPLMVFPPIISLLVAKQKTFLSHLAVVLASMVLAVPVAAIWLLLFI